jgi:hypothetical protein
MANLVCNKATAFAVLESGLDCIVLTDLQADSGILTGCTSAGAVSTFCYHRTSTLLYFHIMYISECTGR